VGDGVDGEVLGSRRIGLDRFEADGAVILHAEVGIVPADEPVVLEVVEEGLPEAAELLLVPIYQGVDLFGLRGYVLFTACKGAWLFF